MHGSRRFLLALSLVTLSVSVFAAAPLTLDDLMKMSGKVIAKGSNIDPVGQFGLKTYRVEELTLNPPVAVIDGQTINAAKAWRITVSGAQIPIRSLAATITLDGVDLRPAMEKDDLSEITSITFDPSLVHNGAPISVSYGGDDPTRLPETLTIK